MGGRRRERKLSYLKDCVCVGQGDPNLGSPGFLQLALLRESPPSSLRVFSGRKREKKRIRLEEVSKNP